MSEHDAIEETVSGYYGSRIREHGSSHAGVDWPSAASQELRFEQLMRVSDGTPNGWTLADYGCGYGGLLDWLAPELTPERYVGIDIAPDMVAAARDRHPTARFATSADGIAPSTFAVASGVFNVRVDTPVDEWERWVESTIEELASLSTAGFAFNMLTSYSEPAKMQPHLYYADPMRWFDHCKRNYSREVAVLHDYGLWEFTVVVRTPGGHEPR